MRQKSSLLLAILSISCGFFTFLIFKNYSPPETFIGGGCVILSFDEAEDDILMQETLASGGFKDFVSESSVKVALNDFDYIRMISLDSYRNEVEVFDPRDDGYAARLRAFFVRGGERFFYYHFDDTSTIRGHNLEKQLKEIFPDTPFTLSFLGQRREILWDFILLFSACIGAFILSRSKLSFFFQLPVLLSFGFGGPGGIALAGLLAAIWELLREPFLELSTARRYNQLSSDYSAEEMLGIRERLKPFKPNFLLTFLFSLLFLLLLFLELVPIIPVIIGCSFLCFINYLYFCLESNTARNNRHIPFIPVLLFPLKTKTFSLFPFLLPFALLSLPALILPGFYSFSMENTTTVDQIYLIDPEEYDRHIELAHSFSYKIFNYELNQFMPDEVYLSYFLGEDGLIAENFVAENNRLNHNLSYPPFPLEKLMLFLLNYESVIRPSVNRIPIDLPLKQWGFVMVIWAACLLDFIQPKKKTRKNASIWEGERIAA